MKVCIKLLEGNYITMIKIWQILSIQWKDIVFKVMFFQENIFLIKEACLNDCQKGDICVLWHLNKTKKGNNSQFTSSTYKCFLLCIYLCYLYLWCLMGNIL